MVFYKIPSLRQAREAWALNGCGVKRRNLVLEAVLWLGLLLGLLPVRGSGPLWSTSKALLASAMAIFSLCNFACYIVLNLESTLIVPVTSSNSEIMYALEKSYPWLTISSVIFMYLVMWFQRGRFLSCCQRLYSLSPTASGVPLQMGAMTIILLAKFLYVGAFSVGTSYELRSIGVQEHVIFALCTTFAFIQLIMAYPLVAYVTCGLMIRERMSQNNKQLRFYLSHGEEEEEEEVGSSRLSLHSDCDEQSLVQIYDTSLKLRQVYKELARVMSLPLLGNNVEIFYWISGTVFFILAEQGMYPSMQAVSCLSTAFALVLILIQGYVADVINDEGQALGRIIRENEATQVLLSHTRLYHSHHFHRSHHHHHYQVPQSHHHHHYQMVQLLAKLSKEPLTITAGGLYTVSRSNLLNIISAAGTYIVIFLQFDGQGGKHRDYQKFGNVSGPF